MAERTTEIVKSLLILLFLFVLAGCANQLPPGGGEVDKIPPKIVETYPENGTTNFHDDHFELTFSEYVDKRTVKDAIFISPAIQGELELDWTGTTVSVDFPEPLKENVTYVITVGTDVVDHNNGNRMAESYTLTFSTGPQIDKRVISGKVYDEKPSGTMIFAYKLKADTVNPSRTKPDYISQAGANGFFQLSGLAAGTYRVFAVADQFRDLLYQVEQDKIGVPFKDITLAPEDTLFTGLNFFLTQSDTTSPRIIKVTMTDRSHILIEMSEETDSSIITTNNFRIVDSAAHKTFKPRYAYNKINGANQLVLVIDSLLNKERDYYLRAEKLIDKKGNVYKNEVTQITVNDKPDTTKPKIIKTIPPERGNVDFINPSLSFYFDDGFDSIAAKTGVELSDTLKKQIKFSLIFPDNASLIIKPQGRLKSSETYLVKIHLANFKDIAGNYSDSIYTFRFSTINEIDFTGATGTMSDVNLSDKPFVVLQSTDKIEGKSYSQYLQKGNKFEFNRVFPGKYLLWCFLDKDSSRTYNMGTPFPLSLLKISPFILTL